MIKWSQCLLAMLICIWPATAQSSGLCQGSAPAKSQMTASLHTHYDKTILLLSGKFDPAAASRVNGHIGRSNTYDEVWMCSNGGRVSQGMAIGRKLASERATVRVPSGFSCVSSCTIAFLGGFVRIIEPDAQYIVHASSSFSAIDPSETRVLDCLAPGAAAVCEQMNKAAPPAARCGSRAQYEDPNGTCLVYDPTSPGRQRRQLGYRYMALFTMPVTENMIQVVVDQISQGDVSYTLTLLKYYQEMLLSGQTRYIRGSAYDRLERNFSLLGIYNPSNYGRDARFLADDVRAINNAEITDRVAIWQSILTDAELNVQRQMVEYIQKNNLSFGPASKDAINILDAMLLCQIQTLCRLKQEEATALGIHNVFDAE
ncbi:MAG: hypothetical protein AAF767_02685 [Pseudomonadota bacterium]